jgi:hypothetical protein
VGGWLLFVKVGTPATSPPLAFLVLCGFVSSGEEEEEEEEEEQEEEEEEVVDRGSNSKGVVRPLPASPSYSPGELAAILASYR